MKANEKLSSGRPRVVVPAGGVRDWSGNPTTTAFRSTFGADYGLTMVDGPMRGLLARAVIVADADGIVRHVQLTESVGQEPDYEAALAALH